MKKAEWTRSFWAKACAFAFATLLAPFACACGASLFAAYGFEWWTGGANEDYWYFIDWAQGRYWTLRGMSCLYALYRAAIPLLAVYVAVGEIVSAYVLGQLLITLLQARDGIFKPKD